VVKKIKEKEGKPWCKFCPEKTVRAVWRSSGCHLDKHACELHKQELQEYEAKQRDGGYMTEADYQTWGRI
jgi:hypothetical protein